MRNTFRHQPACCLLLACGLLFGISAVHADNNDMQRQYQQLKPALTSNAFGIPISIQSNDKQHTMLGMVYGVMDQPFQAVKRALVSPQAWCEIVPQHLNIKACTDAQLDHVCQVTFYSGRKYYENAEDVYKLSYRFDVTHSDATYFQTTLTADDGPMGTSHYRIDVEAIPIEAQKTFLHFRYSYQYNFLTSLSMKAYLATLGSGKVGFSVTGTDAEGKPVYVGGIRGVIERNTIRYYFAIQSYLDTLELEPANRFPARIEKWFALTERFPRQLHELDKKDYLEYKQREYVDQVQLQKQILHPCTTPVPSP
jgi:hypothetical protein